MQEKTVVNLQLWSWSDDLVCPYADGRLKLLSSNNFTVGDALPGARVNPRFTGVNLLDLPLRTGAIIYQNDLVTIHGVLGWLTAQNAGV